MFIWLFLIYKNNKKYILNVGGGGEVSPKKNIMDVWGQVATQYWDGKTKLYLAEAVHTTLIRDIG